MSLDTLAALAPAIVLKPLPDAEATGREPIRIGGAPQLPAGVDWPCHRNVPLHFYAQIDLSALPQNIEDEAGAYEFPDMPRQGTLFIFLMFESDAYFDEPVPQKVIYVPEDVRGNPEVAPPEGTLSIEDFYYLDGRFEPLSPCGKMLRRQFAEVVPYLSAREETGIWMHVEREEGDLAERTAMNALQRHSLAQALGMPELLPDPGAAPEGYDAPWLKSLPGSFQPDFKLRAPRLTWEEIYDWGKEILMEWISYLEDRVRDDWRAAKYGRDSQVPDDVDVDEVRENLEHSWTELNYTWRDPKWSFALRPVLLHLWPKSLPIDRKLATLVFYAKSAVGPVPPVARRRLFQIIAEVEDLAQIEQHVPLRTMEEGAWPYTSSVALRDIAAQALRDLKPRRTGDEPRPDDPTTWDEKVREETMMPYPSRNNFSVSGGSRAAIQMFGEGYLLQHAALRHAQDVLLLQLAEPFGTGISFMGDALLQLWIAPDDLSAARFDRVKATFETT